MLKLKSFVLLKLIEPNSHYQIILKTINLKKAFRQNKDFIHHRTVKFHNIPCNSHINMWHIHNILLSLHGHTFSI